MRHLEVISNIPTSKKNEIALKTKWEAKRRKTKIIGMYTENLTDPNPRKPQSVWSDQLETITGLKDNADKVSSVIN